MIKVFEFTLGESDDSWIDWVVAENAEQALEHLKTFSDMGDEEYDLLRSCKELSESELNELVFYEFEDETTGEPINPRSFTKAISGREEEIPFHLCSQID